MQKLTGIPASPGIASGHPYIMISRKIEFERKTDADVGVEWTHLEAALAQAGFEITQLRERAAREIGEEEAAIFDAHALFLEDPVLLEAAREAMEAKGLNAPAAWSDTIKDGAKQLEDLDDDNFRARAADLRDVGRRVLRLLVGQDEVSVSGLTRPSIIVAEDLAPSDTARLDKAKVLGFCTAAGGPTSHTAILARALGKPAVVGVGAELLDIDPGVSLLIDGKRGEVWVDPDDPTRQRLESEAAILLSQMEAELEHALEPAVTVDGHAVEVVANVGNLADAQAALTYGAEGIGLLRTEFLFLDRDTPPDEELQASVLSEIFRTMEDRPIVVRTLDIGGDKPLPYMPMPREDNPFLGWRAIRLCLEKPEVFRPHLRAILRAGHGHDLRIMFPMISSLMEVQRGAEEVRLAISELAQAGLNHCPNPQIGIMVEVPSTVTMADRLAHEVDFFSIGTNDLTQYTFAAERGNPRVAHLGDAIHPAVLRQISAVIEAAHDTGIWVGLCGELAGDDLAIPILLGLGLDEFSMAPPFIPHAKSTLRRWDLGKAKELAGQALLLDTGDQVRSMVTERQTA
jgi:phosphoenolpyruvate-protein phosphotransferase